MHHGTSDVTLALEDDVYVLCAKGVMIGRAPRAGGFPLDFGTYVTKSWRCHTFTFPGPAHLLVRRDLNILIRRSLRSTEFGIAHRQSRDRRSYPTTWSACDRHAIGDRAVNRPCGWAL